ncbi:MFS transporter [Nocardioides sp. R-C-SC26]|uniref:MFS transporter n=1 Tax=Nocardioides sp. R-C-SC26 TaxID=2870414 RepID=UPI001E2DBD45|nr:MFS transporter [Nocardioides sp. R-C-SC26]
MTSTGASSFRFRDIAVAAYGPSVLASIGGGAALPVFALHARELGASVSTAAFVVALLGLGSLLTSLPGGALIARIGERRALVVAGLVDAAALLGAALTTSVVALGFAVTTTGAAWTVFMIARQGFIIDAVPITHRARALSGLGATLRIGMLLGPLAGAALIHWRGLSAVFVFAAALSLGAALLAWTVPDLGAEHRADARAHGHLSVGSVLRSERRAFATVGVAVLIIGISRSIRPIVVPLWAEQLGIQASAISLMLAVAAAVDLVFFLPGGWLMDRRGRAVVAVPVVATVAAACLLLPLTGGVVTVTLAALLIAVGNGLGSGVVMTLGADSAPALGRAQFLGGWRLLADLGNAIGPLLVSAVAAVAPLAAALVVVGAILTVGTGWVGHWTLRLDRSRLAPPGPQR